MFRVLHSSAGAGKTHALVKHYLLLALQGPDPGGYARILALTFTNKAAGEMRERILHYLEGLGGDEALTGALADVRDTITKETGITGEELRLRAQRTLTHMLHHWPRLAVSTIDAFTRRVVMPFARDLRLDHDLRMTTEEDHYRAKAVDLLLEEAGTDHALTRLLVAACEQLLDEERSWRPDRPLLELSRQLSREDALEHLAALRELDSGYFLALRDRLRARVEAFRDRMQQLGREAWQAVQQADLTEKDLAYGKSGPWGYVRNLVGFDTWQKENKNVLRALENDKWAAGTVTPTVRSAVEGIAPVLSHVIGTVEGLRPTAMRDHAIAAAVLRELMPTAALNALDQRLERTKQEDGVAFFSDLTRKVAAVVQDEPAPFLYERIGEKYRHFLIDEFQDTSLLQWHALLPLLENALSSGGSALLVGDAKQAIYRWRNGEVRQFVMLPELFAKDRLAHGEEREQALVRAFEPTEPLADNHRSARGIIAFNNTLIAALKDELHEEVRAVYHRHEQAPVRTNEGYVEMACYGGPDDEAEEAKPAPAFAERVVAEAIADGFRPGDIAVLVRTKEQGRTIAAALAAAGHEVVSPDGLALGDDVAVNAVIALLAWTLHPDDANAAHAVQYMALLGADAAVDPFGGVRAPRELLQAWSARHPLITRRLPLLSALCRIMAALGHDPATDAFLMGLLDEAHTFTKEHGDDRAGFLTHWERVARKRSVGGTPGLDAVRIMTVHASKGLQFPVVVVPFVGRTRGGAGDHLWIDPGAAVPGLPTALVRMQEPLTGFDLPEIAEEQRLRALDDLDVLYVAFTRAEQRLYAGVDGKSHDRFAKALRTHLGLAPGISWTSGERAAALIKPERPRDTFTLSASGADAQRTLAIRREAPEEWDPADPDPQRSRGRLLHAILARVDTPADLPQAIAAESAIAHMDEAERHAVEERLKELLARPELALFFGEGLDVRTETTLIDADGHALRPDRVVRQGERLRVLDIKTGAPSERHEEQVRGYAALLRQVELTDVEAYLLYLNEGLLIAVDA